MFPIRGYIQTTMGHFWTVAPHNKNAIINTSWLKYKKKCFLILALGESKLTIKNQEKLRNLSHVWKVH